MEDNPIDKLFADFDILTKEEYLMLFSKVLNKFKSFNMTCNIVNGYLKQVMPVLAVEIKDVEECRNLQENMVPFVFLILVEKALKDIVYDKNPKKKIYEIVDRLFLYVKESEWCDILNGLNDTTEKMGWNMLISLIVYTILYYRYRELDDYSRYILPALAEYALPMVREDGGFERLHRLTEALPPHDETEAERARQEPASDEDVRDRLVKADEEIRRLKMRVIDLEAELNDARNEAETAHEGEDSPRFYKRKMQLRLLGDFMKGAGVDIRKNKSAAALLMSNLLHISNYKSVQKMLSEDPYLRTADHGEACAEANGILKELGSPFLITCKASKSVQKSDMPVKEYTEILKSYKNTGE